MFQNCRRDGGDALKNLPRGFGIGNLEAVGFVQGDNQLEGVHRIQTNAAGAEQRLIIANLFGADLEHEVFDHQPPDVLLDRRYVIHYKMPKITLDGKSCTIAGFSASRESCPASARRFDAVSAGMYVFRLFHQWRESFFNPIHVRQSLGLG